MSAKGRLGSFNWRGLIEQHRAREPQAITYGMFNLFDVRTGGSLLKTPDPLGRGCLAELDDAE
jgi:hypothetical protein